MNNSTNSSSSNSAPYLVSMLPAATGTASVSANIVLVFSVPVMAGSNQVRIFDEAGNKLFEASATHPRITMSGKQVTIDLPIDLAYATTFTVGMDYAFVKGLDGVEGESASRTFMTENSPFGMTLTGTEGADQLRGGEGADQLSGLGGDDSLQGYGGDDMLDGGDGNDTISSTGGSSILRGGNGNDRLQSTSAGLDRMDGGPGDDTLLGGEGGDMLDGGSGNDAIEVEALAGSGRPIGIAGGEGQDRIHVRLGENTTADAAGGSGIDTFGIGVIGAQSLLTISDFVAGPTGDLLDVSGLLTADRLGQGNPFGSLAYLRLQQQGGDTVLQFDADGAAGAQFTYTTVVSMADVSMGAITAANFAGGVTPSSSQEGLLFSGTPGDDVVNGSMLSDSLRGGAGNDTLDGGAGDDLLDGDAGDDRLKGGPGNDRLAGGAGDDALDGGLGDDHLDGGDGNDVLVGLEGSFTMAGGAGDDRLNGYGRGASLLAGGEGDDVIETHGGTHTLQGGDGRDTLLVDVVDVGAAPPPWNNLPPVAISAVLDGGAQDDTFDVKMPGVAGQSVVATGGTGIDTFIMRGTVTAGSYVVTDFQAGSGGDQIDLSRFLSYGVGESYNPLDPARNMVRLQQRGADTVIEANNGGASGAATWGKLVVLKGVAVSSLTEANFTGAFMPDGSRNDVRLTGSAGSDVLCGQFLDDVLLGGDGEDTLIGSRGNDRLDGGDGNDLLVGGVGKNELIGGSGIDTAVYEWTRSGIRVQRTDNGWAVDNPSIVLLTVSIQDALSGIERLRFSDMSWALDVDGTAGKVYRLYQAAFDRTPDKVGVGFWMAKIDQGLAIAAVLDFFIGSPEFVALYGVKPTNTELVGRFYQNVLHREPDASGKAFWIKVLDEGRASVADVLSNFSESPENQQELAKIIGNGFAYQEYV